MTTQEAYEGIRAFFSKKGARLAKAPDGSCFYRVGKRADAKIRCAIGCLIPDEKYDPRMDGENGGLGGTDFDRAVEATGVDSEESYDFLTSAQIAHDHSDGVAEFRKKLDNIAREFGLTVPA